MSNINPRALEIESAAQDYIKKLNGLPLYKSLADIDRIDVWYKHALKLYYSIPSLTIHVYEFTTQYTTVRYVVIAHLESLLKQDGITDYGIFFNPLSGDSFELRIAAPVKDK